MDSHFIIHAVTFGTRATTAYPYRDRDTFDQRHVTKQCSFRVLGFTSVNKLFQVYVGDCMCVDMNYIPSNGREIT